MRKSSSVIKSARRQGNDVNGGLTVNTPSAAVEATADAQQHRDYPICFDMSENDLEDLYEQNFAKFCDENA